MDPTETVPPEEQQERLQKKGIFTTEAITILAPPETLYHLWMNPQNFQNLSDQLESVTKISETKTHWVWRALKDRTRIEWDSEIVEKKENQYIAWRSTLHENLLISGRVEFDLLPYGRGTVVRVKLGYDVPIGKMAVLLEKVLGESPHRNLKLFLVRLRQFMETGELARVEGQSAGNDRDKETNTALH
ncbi:SRPBCC family protein [Bdellovibrio sp. HCB2-146]|uniref:SRPBCC family protein n=1 Tax=Bdellovibrio sp. HCB2-146 TaxID=3394362 RepID=UPI0039BD2220